MNENRAVGLLTTRTGKMLRAVISCIHVEEVSVHDAQFEDLNTIH